MSVALDCADRRAGGGETRLLPIILVTLFLLLMVLGIVLGNAFETYHTGSSLWLDCVGVG